MKEYIITAGSAYVDIDVLACAVAYKNLLKLCQKSAVIVTTGPFNETIPKSVRSWQYTLERKIPSTLKNKEYVLVDVSDPLYFEKFVDVSNIYRIFDHHFGFEKYWSSKIGERSNIAHVGSCATLIWEEFIKYNKEGEIDIVSANLLYTAIFANTLDLKASVTSPRDKEAFLELTKFTDLPDNWKKIYYNEIEKSIIGDVRNSVQKDLKRVKINDKRYSIGQIELWDSSLLFKISNLLSLVKLGLDIKKDNPDRWFLIISDITLEKNYIITNDNKTIVELENTIEVSFSGWIGETSKLYMRKEILKYIINKDDGLHE